MRSPLNAQRSKMSGFTLLELVLVTAILAIISVLSFGNFLGSYRSIELQAIEKTIAADLRLARTRAMSGEDSLRWGVHFVNGAAQYYELFATPTNYGDPGVSVKARVDLPQGIAFTEPAAASTKDILFEKVSGTTTASIITLGSSYGAKTLSVSAQGAIEE